MVYLWTRALCNRLSSKTLGTTSYSARIGIAQWPPSFDLCQLSKNIWVACTRGGYFSCRSLLLCLNTKLVFKIRWQMPLVSGILCWPFYIRACGIWHTQGALQRWWWFWDNLSKIFGQRSCGGLPHTVGLPLKWQSTLYSTHISSYTFDSWASCGSLVVHFGREKTIIVVEERFFWSYIRCDIAHIVQHCVVCQTANG